MERIKGVTLSIYTENYLDLLRQYQDPEGWAVTDAGTNEDEDGYYFDVEARGVGGVRQICIQITADALKGMLNALDMDYVPLPRYTTSVFGNEFDFELTPKTTNTANTSSCCVDGCPCQKV